MSSKVTLSGSGRPSHPYAASKGGIIGLSNSMAVHYGRDNIRVNCILPGFMYTPMVAPHVSEEMRDLRMRAAPLGTEGTAWDVAWAARAILTNTSRSNIWESRMPTPLNPASSHC